MTTKVLIANFGPGTLGVMELHAPTPKGGEAVQLPAVEFEKVVAPGNTLEVWVHNTNSLLVIEKELTVQPVK